MNYCNIYRSFQLGCLLFLALASLSSHSAYADWVVDAKCVNRPNNILKGISGYATGGVNSNNSCFYTCPPGGFTPHPQAPAVCTHNATGLNITGWEFVWFEDCPSSGCHTYPSGQYASEITLQSQNQDVGCTTNCDEPTYTYVFIGDQNGWRYLGTAVDYYSFFPSTHHFGIFPLQPFRAALIARWGGGTHRPDPLWFEITQQPLQF